MFVRAAQGARREPGTPARHRGGPHTAQSQTHLPVAARLPAPPSDPGCPPGRIQNAMGSCVRPRPPADEDEDEDEDEQDWSPPPRPLPTATPLPPPALCIRLGGVWQGTRCTFPLPDDPGPCRCRTGSGVPGPACRTLHCAPEPESTHQSLRAPPGLPPPGRPHSIRAPTGAPGPPLTPLDRWIDPVVADTLARQTACTHPGAWLEKTAYVGGGAFDPPRPVLWSQSRQWARPPVERIAIEITFTQASINAIVGGRWQRQFPGAYVHQAATEYC